MRFNKSIILLVVLLAGLCLFTYILEKENAQIELSRQKLPEVRMAFHQIKHLTGAAPVSELMETGESMTVGVLYQTNLKYSEIRAYYDDELAKNGYRFQKELKTNGADGKDYGGKQVFYSNGELTAFIHHVGEKPNSEYSYYFCIYWNP
jgi:hypothetical protein